VFNVLDNPMTTSRHSSDTATEAAGYASCGIVELAIGITNDQKYQGLHEVIPCR